MTDSDRRYAANHQKELNDDDSSHISLEQLDLWPEKEVEVDLVQDMTAVYVVQRDTHHENQSSRFKTEPSSQLCKTIVTWSEEQTHLMLALYRDKIANIGLLKKYKNKKQMYESISDDIKDQLGISFTALQIENRFKNVAKKHKDVLKNSMTVDRTPYAEEMAAIAAIDVSIEPDIIMTPTLLKRKTKDGDTKILSKRMKQFDEPGPSSENCDETLASSSPRRDTEMTSALIAAYRKETERKAKRDREKAAQHREKMQQFDRLIGILADISKKMGK